MAWTIATIVRDNIFNIVSKTLIEQSSFLSGYVDPNCLECSPFGILNEKAISRIPLTNNKIKRRGHESLFLLRASLDTRQLVP